MRPANFATRVQGVLADLGVSAASQTERAAQLHELWQETVRLCGDLYVPKMLPT